MPIEVVPWRQSHLPIEPWEYPEEYQAFHYHVMKQLKPGPAREWFDADHFVIEAWKRLRLINFSLDLYPYLKNGECSSHDKSIASGLCIQAEKLEDKMGKLLKAIKGSRKRRNLGYVGDLVDRYEPGMLFYPYLEGPWYPTLKAPGVPYPLRKSPKLPNDFREPPRVTPETLHKFVPDDPEQRRRESLVKFPNPDKGKKDLYWLEWLSFDSMYEAADYYKTYVPATSPNGIRHATDLPFPVHRLVRENRRANSSRRKNHPDCE